MIRRILATTMLSLVVAGSAKAAPEELPYKSQGLRLDQVLKRSLAQNPKLRETAIDVAVSESTILSALGQFDPQLEASFNLSYNEQTPRGSQIVFSVGDSSQTLSLGVGQKLRTGGRYRVNVDIIHSRTDQINFLDPTSGTNKLDGYVVAPKLELSHPLLRGMGIKVNTAQLRKGRLAKTQAQAQAQQAAQDKVREVLFAYWDLAFAHGDLENKRQAREHAKELLEKTRAEVEAGRTAPVQIKAVEQSLATKEQAVLSASVQIFEQSLALRELMADPLNPSAALGIQPLTAIAASSDTITPLREVLALTMKRHPQIRQLELALATRRIDEIKAINDKLPTLDLALNLSARGRSVDTLENAAQNLPAQNGSWGDAFRNFFNETPKEDGLLADFRVDASLRFAWDIKNRLAKGQAQGAHQEILRAQLNLESISRSLRAQAIRAHMQRTVAQKSLQVARLAVDLAKVNLEAEKARYSAGRSTNYDVLSRIDEHAAAQNQVLQAQIQSLKAQVQEQLLTGTLLAAYGIEARS